MITRGAGAEEARLVRPTAAVRDSYLAGERADCEERGADTGWLTAAAADFEQFAAEVGRTKKRWGVPSTVLWYVSGENYLGTLVIRHELTPELEQVGGHIGFHVMRAFQRQGHATRMLAASLVHCRRLGLTQVLVTCHPGNLASQRVIHANGGVPAEPDPSGELRFWIDVAGVSLRPLTRADAAAHCAGEDAQTVRWLTGGYGSVEGTADYFEQLAANAAAGCGKRGFGVLLGDRLAGYVDFELDEDGSGDGLEVGDVNLTYAVHPWARGRGVAVDAVRLLCTLLREQRVGSRAAIRVEPDNVASVRVARAVGFDHVGDFVSTTETQESGEPVVFSRYVLALRGAHP